MTLWYEKRGGYVVASCLYLVVFSYMLVTRAQENDLFASEPPPIEVSFVMEEAGGGAEPMPAAMAANAAAAASPGAAAGGDMADEIESPPKTDDEEDKDDAEVKAEFEKPEPRTEEPPTPVVQKAPVATPAPEEKPEPTPAPEEKPAATPQPREKVSEEGLKLAAKKEADELAEAAASRAEQKRNIAAKEYEAFQRQIASHGQTTRKGRSLADAISAAKVRTMGRAKLAPTRGAAEGAVRRFELLGDQRIIDQVMARYDMRIVTRYVTKKETGSSYLSQAKTERGTYENDGRAGPAEVFEIGAAGSKKMKALEVEAVRAEGYDPANSRVIEIVFGIVHTGPDQYDLGVTSSTIEPLEAARRSEPPAPAPAPKATSEPVPTSAPKKATPAPIYFGKP